MTHGQRVMTAALTSRLPSGSATVSPSPHRRARTAGQSIVEMALITPLAIGIVLVTLQTSLIVAQFWGAGHVSRATARWLAVRIDTTDSAVDTYARSLGAPLPGLSGTGITSVAVNPSCPSLSGGKCSARSPGDAVTVTVTAAPARVMFLPTSISVFSSTISLPTTLPPVSTTVVLE
ncbi:MAG: hypothetical protein IT305_18785 [Chloroflexi bacterium]|nr:hypothetical protein [Chloroflexota bacterium]